MLNWYKELYVGDTVKKELNLCKRKLEKKKVLKDVFLITIAANGVDQLDIINSHYLLQDSLYRRCPMIVGIAKGKEEALQLLLQMTEETVKQTGTGDIKKFLMQG